MAASEETVSNRKHNVIGNKREDSGTFTVSAGETTGFVNTTLHWIEQVDIISPDGDGTDVDVDLNLYPNTKSQSTSEDTDDAGWFFFAGALAAGVYQFRARGI